jgi:hypothetical protein
MRKTPDGSHYSDMKHISDDDLERYYLGMVRPDSEEDAAIEEHLLACNDCVVRAAETQDYVDAMRAAIIRGNFDLDVVSIRPDVKPAARIRAAYRRPQK